MRALLSLGLTLALSTPALAIEPGMEKCWSDTLYRQYDCPAVGWPYGTITQEQVGSRDPQREPADDLRRISNLRGAVHPRLYSGRD